MNESNKSSDDCSPEWEACDTGTLSGLGQRLRTEHTRAAQKRLVGGALAATAAAVLVFALLPAGGVNQPGAPDPASIAADPWSITCQECVAMMPGYHDLLVSGETTLSATDSETVAAHIKACPKCQDHFEADYPGVLAAATAGLGLLGFATRRLVGA